MTFDTPLGFFYITANHPDDALKQGLYLLNRHGVWEETRNGRAVVLPSPVMTVNLTPRNRVSLLVARDANPFFHLYESLWMLGGREDVDSLTRFVPRMADFSDNGSKFHGAYGHRWRRAWGDQVEKVISILRADTQSRRAVIQMWSALSDLGTASRDLPCNTHIYFRVQGASTLDMTVCCRSNDAIWGTHGANVVHFSFLQEYVACRLGLDVGRLYQLSNNYHAYEDLFNKYKKSILHSSQRPSPTASKTPLLSLGYETAFHADLLRFLDGGDEPFYQTPFFTSIAGPMMRAHHHYRRRRVNQAWYDAVRTELSRIVDPSWFLASFSWMQRRFDAWRRAQDDGVRYED